MSGITASADEWAEPLRVYLLASVRLEHASIELSLTATQKATSLLGYLVTHPGRRLARELLAKLFWPNRPPTNARRSLHTALWQIRHTLKQSGLNPEHFLSASSASVEWLACENTWLDIAEFDSAAANGTLASLQRAATFYRGSFMEGLYEEWAIIASLARIAIG